MGTLFDQRPRQDSLQGYMEWIISVGTKLGFPAPDKLGAEGLHALCDLTRTALAIQNADVLDEQLGGFGELLKEFNEFLLLLQQEEEAEQPSHVPEVSEGARKPG